MASRPRKIGTRGVPHVGKTESERRDYVEQVVQGGGLSPTVATSLAPEGAGTDSPLPESEQIFRRTTSPRRRSARKPDWFERNKDELIKYVIGSLIVGGITTSLYFSYMLNREVGEIQTVHKNTVRDIDDLRTRLGRSEDRIDRIRDMVQPAKRPR
jgi:hypothetical protein